jgi:hypothetical protein
MRNMENDMNLVERWLRFDAKRWIAGILAGVFAGAVALAIAGLIASATGFEFWFPAKVMATIVQGSHATEYGSGFGAILSGIILFEAICVFFGIIYAHFTATNSLPALLGIGLVWGAFSWIFIWNLFLQSFYTIFVMSLSAAAAFPVCIAYGLSLTSVAFFDRAIRGGDLA